MGILSFKKQQINAVHYLKTFTYMIYGYVLVKLDQRGLLVGVLCILRMVERWKGWGMAEVV